MSKLAWMPTVSRLPLTWKETERYLKEMGEGWRLPTRREVHDSYPQTSIHFVSYVWTSERGNCPGFRYAVQLPQKTAWAISEGSQERCHVALIREYGLNDE